MRLSLDLIDEVRDEANTRNAEHQRRASLYYNRRFKERFFQQGDLVLRKIDASGVGERGKLAPNWEGPYKVRKTLGRGSYKLETLNGEEVPHTCHASNLKPIPISETFNVCEATYSREDCDKDSDNFKRFVADVEQPLFEGSECTELESVLKLHNWKARFGVSDKAFTDLLQSIGSIIPKDNLLPSNMYEAKKTLIDLGIEYIKFHDCPNDCILYRSPVLESSSECPKCHLSRWKVGKDGQVRVNIPAKVMWYNPIIPRFKRMFKSSSTAKLMSWHANNRSKDGKMRHPSNSPSWRNVDCRWPEFGSEARNIRLRLGADDVMHVKKNVCDNIIGTLLHMKFKSKDSLSSRLDLVDIGIQPDLAPKIGEKRTYLPHAPYTLSRKEKQTMLASLYGKKLPYRHVSNIKNRVLMIDMKLYGLKSHDCHILLQQLLPVCIRSVLPKNVRVSIIRLCFFFNSLCNKVVDVSKLNKLQADVILTLCELEKIFPPSFFDVMIHLMVHLVRELRLCGLFFYRWMFPFEHFNKILKSYVRNRFYPESYIAEGYLKEESIEFCSEFYSGSSRIAGFPKDEEKISGPIGGVTMKLVAEKERDEAHLSVLLNNSEVGPYVMLHKKIFGRDLSREKEEYTVAIGRAQSTICRLESYAVRGVRYHTKDRNNARVVQNSGVSLVARTVQVSSAKDMNPIESDLKFYAVIREIWELDYHAFKAPLFLCTWEASDKGVKSDDLGFTLVNFNRPGHKKDKYVSVDQVNKVFYIEDPVDANWSVLLSATTRNYHDVYNEDAPKDTSWNLPPFCYNIPTCEPTNIDDASVCNKRENIEGICVKKL
ncbi:uncharacterized protein LOC141701019 [Apium graveolens]|uniref:uncharacterized protein LOC141701019 n=1 Tax=Apium graveolens TaxID=4045 RepID=UPI003D7AED40